MTTINEVCQKSNKGPVIINGRLARCVFKVCDGSYMVDWDESDVERFAAFTEVSTG